MSKEMETKLINFEGGELLGVRAEDGKIYLGIKKSCLDIGLTERQVKTQIKDIKNDPLLKNNIKQLSMKQKEGERYINRPVSCLEIKFIPIWLAKISPKILNRTQYRKMMELINWCLSEDFDSLKTPTKVYSYETELRDEIYSLGYFNDIKITGKEVMYDFGRIDLEGIDKDNKKVCIELKRYKEFDYTKKQLLKYKKSNRFDRIIYCCYIIDDNFKKWSIENNIEIVTYKRVLSLLQYNENKKTILDFGIKDFKFGLEDFKDKENYIPTSKQVLEYKKDLQQLFQQYQMKLKNVINSNNHDLAIKYDIILFYLKKYYESNIEEFVEDIKTKFDEKEIIEINAVDYLRDVEYPKILKIDSLS